MIGAPVAGELSGHICFSDFFGYDDALYAACRLVDLVARQERPLSTLVDEFPKYVSTPEIRVEVPEEEKFEIVRRAAGIPSASAMRPATSAPIAKPRSRQSR